MPGNSHKGEAPVHIAPYDPSWPSLFGQERAILESTLAPWLTGTIEHIGSTAVPGLVAKPVIDIMAGVESLAASLPAISALAVVGYVYFPYKPESMHWFCKPSAFFRTHHLHLVPFGDPLWNERLVFRDYLRSDPTTAANYAKLKQRLAKQYEFDREAYTNAKEPFIQDVLRIAKTREP